MTENINTYIKIRETTFSINKKEDIEFNDLYTLIGCHTVELISLPNGIDLWVDEEGLLKENVITEISIKDFNKIRIAGTGVLLSFGEDGYSTGLSTKQVEYITNNISIRPYGKIGV